MTPEEFQQYIDIAARNMARVQERLGPCYVEAHINFIDALRDIIRAEVRIADELLGDGAITRQEYDKGMIEIKQPMMILKKREDHEINPTLRGLLK